MMYHPMKLGRKKRSSSVDMVEIVIFDYMNPHCDHELKMANQSFCMTVNELFLVDALSTKNYIRAEHKLQPISKVFISQVITPQVMFFLAYLYAVGT